MGGREGGPLVFDVIIAGWVVVVSLSRLKWKIALRILALLLCHVPIPHTNIPPLTYPCLSGCVRPLGRGSYVSSPKSLVWFLSVKSAAVPVVKSIGIICCFIPQSNRLSLEVRAVNGLVSGRGLGWQIVVAGFVWWFVPDKPF